MALSVQNRPVQWQESQNTEFDLVVIGGGITGAGVALDAVSRGLKVALFEMQDYAEGTSSRSTKLIHGGLRYLRQFKFQQVKEVGRERNVLFENAPHLIWPQKMIVPVIRGGAYSSWQLKVGLWLYDKLINTPAAFRHELLDAEQTLNAEPLLDRELIQGGAKYVEYQTDDARLVISVLKKADQLGALCFNYARVTAFGNDGGGQINGVEVLDILDDKSHQIRAKKVINCTGPWVDDVREKAGPLGASQIFHTKGVHLVFHRKMFPVQQACYLGLRDGRMIFAIPRGEYVYAGTTDTPYPGELGNPTVDPDDKVYLLKALNRNFANVKLTRSDVVSSWAGIRPLIHQRGKSPSKISRKDEIFIHPSGLLSIAGGKLTGYRLMAKTIVDLAVKQLGLEESEYSCVTESLKLSGGDFNESIDVFEQRLHQEHPNVPPPVLHAWIRRYGSSCTHLLEQVNTAHPTSQFRTIEVEYCKAFEGVVNPEDFERRRTDQALFPLNYLMTKTLSSKPSSNTI